MNENENKIFQKKLAKLQIQASAIITIAAILLAIGFTSWAFLEPVSDDMINWGLIRGLIFVIFGVFLIFYHLLVIRNQINKL